MKTRMSAFSLRPPSPSDVERLVELNECQIAESGVHEDHETGPEILNRWAMPGFDRERDERLAIVEGALAGSIYFRTAGDDMADAIAYVRPEFRNQGIGTAFVRWMTERARGQAGIRELYAYGSTSAPGSIELVKSVPGARLTRNFLRIRHPNPGGVPEPVWPDGVAVEYLHGGALADAVIEVKDAAFKNNWGFRPTNREELLHEMAHIDDRLWPVITLKGKPIGYFQGRIRTALGLTYGEGYGFGVLEQYRGTPVSNNLLRLGLRSMAAAGAKEIAAGVDGKLWSAIFMYTAEGFVPTHERLAFQLPLGSEP